MKSKPGVALRVKLVEPNILECSIGHAKGLMDKRNI